MQKKGFGVKGFTGPQLHVDVPHCQEENPVHLPGALQGSSGV